MNASEFEHDPPALEPAENCWFLTGATAAGKSSVGVLLAQRWNAEIISLDSMAIYRGMDIGTAKPTLEQQATVPHHLVDICDPTEDFSLSQYVQAAHQAAAEIRGRGKQVLFVGGTPLYLKALLRGVYQGPPADWEFRQEVEEEVRRVGLPALHQRLWQVDPVLASKLHPSDKRRIIRALEVHKATGKPLSHRQVQFEEEHTAKNCRVFVISWPRRELHERIARRVEGMLQRGLLDELKGLLERYRQLGRTASQALGYRECLQYLEGLRDWSETEQRIKARTRQFARRQETWFRALSECESIPASADDSAEIPGDPAARSEALCEAVWRAAHSQSD